MSVFITLLVWCGRKTWSKSNKHKQLVQVHAQNFQIACNGSSQWIPVNSREKHALKGVYLIHNNDQFMPAVKTHEDLTKVCPTAFKQQFSTTDQSAIKKTMKLKAFVVFGQKRIHQGRVESV